MTDHTASIIILDGQREQGVAVLALKLYCRTLWPMRDAQVLRDDIKAGVRVLRRMPTRKKISRSNSRA